MEVVFLALATFQTFIFQLRDSDLTYFSEFEPL